MFQRLQRFTTAFKEKLFVSPVNVRDDFFFSRCFAIGSPQHAHADRKLQFARAHGVLQKLPQRIRGSIAIELSVFHNFRRHGEIPLDPSMRQKRGPQPKPTTKNDTAKNPIRYLSLRCVFTSSFSPAPAPPPSPDAADSATTADRCPPNCSSKYTPPTRSKSAR